MEILLALELNLDTLSADSDNDIFDTIGFNSLSDTSSTLLGIYFAAIRFEDSSGIVLINFNILILFL